MTPRWSIEWMPPAACDAWLAELKSQIREARLRAALAVNADVIA